MAQQFSAHHRFGGGWATSIGSTVDLAPDASGQLTIPYLLQADNCFYELDGSPHKEFGTVALNAAIEANPIRGLFDFWVNAVTQHRVLAIGDEVYADSGDGAFVSIASGLSDTATVNFNALDNILIYATDGDSPMSWDGSTWQALAGTPPNFSFSVNHNGHVFAGGDKTNRSRISWSVPFDPEDWVGAGSGNITIDPNDGDEITGLASYKQRLIVFKGPNKGSIHLITGTSSSDFAVVPLQTGIGAVWQNSITRFADDIAFQWSDGHVYSLAATEAFGDFRQGAQLTLLIQSWIEEHFTLSSMKKTWGVSWPARGIMLFAVAIDSSTTPNFVLMIDYRSQQVIRLAPWPAFDLFPSLALVVDGSSRRPIVMGGGNDGIVYRLGQPTRSLNGNAFGYNVKTPFMNYGNEFILKTLQTLSVGFTPHNVSDLNVEWTRNDGSAPQSIQVSQGGGDVLGDVPGGNEFVLDASTLARNADVEKYVDIENGGQARAFQYRFFETEQDVETEIHSFGAIYEIDGPSWENN